MEFWQTLAFLFSIVAYIPYVVYVATNKVQMTLSSWLCWIAIDLAMLANLWTLGQPLGQIAAFVAGAALVLTAATYRRSALAWQPFDTVCLIMVLAACAAWYVSGNAKVGLVCILFASIVSPLPLLRNIYHNPLAEKMSPWFLFYLGSICQMLSFQSVDWWALATPLSWSLLQATVLAMLIVGRIRIRIPNTHKSRP